MKKLILLSILLLSISYSVNFSKTFDFNKYDSGNSLAYANGNYIISGNITPGGSTSGDYHDGFILKTDSLGNEIWRKVLGGERYDVINSIKVTTENEYILVGTSESSGNGNQDVWIIKLDISGNILWDKYYDWGMNEIGHSIQELSNNNFIIVGSSVPFSGSDSNVRVFKIDSNGNEVWSYQYGGYDEEFGYSIISTSDGGYAIAGSTKSYVVENEFWSDLFFLKIDENGLEEWFKNFGTQDADKGNTVFQGSDGSFYIGGQSGGNGTDYNYYVVKTDANGTEIWSKIFNIAWGIGSGHDNVAKILPLNDDIIIMGTVDSFANSGSEIGILKIDYNGNILLEKKIGYETGTNIGMDIIQSDEGFTIVGHTFDINDNDNIFDIWLLKTDLNFNSCIESFEYDYDCLCNPNSFEDECDICNGSGAIYLCTNGELTCSQEDCPDLALNGLPLSEKYGILSNFPNPFNPSTTISFSIPKLGLITITAYDLRGKEIEILTNTNLNPGNYSIDWNATSYPSGIYLIRMDSGDFTQTQKVVLIK